VGSVDIVGHIFSLSYQHKLNWRSDWDII